MREDSNNTHTPDDQCTEQAIKLKSVHVHIEDRGLYLLSPAMTIHNNSIKEWTN